MSLDGLDARKGGSWRAGFPGTPVPKGWLPHHDASGHRREMHCAVVLVDSRSSEGKAVRLTVAGQDLTAAEPGIPQRLHAVLNPTGVGPGPGDLASYRDGVHRRIRRIV